MKILRPSNNVTVAIPESEKRKIEVINILREERIVQNGFTRNWRFYNGIKKLNKYFVMIVESDKAGERPNIDNYDRLWAIPDYAKGEVRIFKGKLGHKKGYSSCNCYGYYEKKIGCFTER